MGLFKRKPDPISDRERALSSEIAALEAEIQQLHAAVEQSKTQAPSGALRNGEANDSARPEIRGPLFEPVDQDPLKSPARRNSDPAPARELGVRQNDWSSKWSRLQNHFRAPPPSNPKLVNYLAAGGIQGLRPLRYEKRIARNRVIFLCGCFALGLYVIYKLVM